MKYFNKILITSLLLGIGLLFTNQSPAQDSSIFTSSIKGKWVRQAEDALKPYFYLIRVEYLLEEEGTKDQYGREGKSYFNRRYAVGIFSEECLWVEKTLIEAPWMDDPIYEEYQSEENLYPVVSKIEYRAMGNFEFVPSNTLPLKDTLGRGNNLINTYDLAEAPLGLAFSAAKITDGLAVYFHSKSALDPNAFDIDFVWSETKGENDLNLKTPNLPNIIGGVYFDVLSEKGSIQFKPYALIQYNDEERDALLLPFPKNVRSVLSKIDYKEEEEDATTEEETEVEVAKGEVKTAKELEKEEGEKKNLVKRFKNKRAEKKKRKKEEKKEGEEKEQNS